MLINLIISLLIMEAVTIIKRLKSKKDKNYSIKLSYNNEIHIFITREVMVYMTLQIIHYIFTIY